MLVFEFFRFIARGNPESWRPIGMVFRVQGWKRCKARLLEDYYLLRPPSLLLSADPLGSLLLLSLEGLLFSLKFLSLFSLTLFSVLSSEVFFSSDDLGLFSDLCLQVLRFPLSFFLSL